MKRALPIGSTDKITDFFNSVRSERSGEIFCHHSNRAKSRRPGNTGIVTDKRY